ncbi:MAG TPA: c-type cytochrome domain-containing protein, partial [Planctomycetaceae bacterium]|nr:c-type cytochrome domain-containing protein [Planctomycetaceae bacterium]
GKIEPVAVALGRPVNFDQDIVPILDAKCVACHNVAIAESRLILEDVPHILKGGKRGPAVVAKDPEKSLMYQVAARAAEPAMPPLPNKVSADKITPQELGLLRQWILEGAPAGASGTAPPAIAWQPLSPHLHAIYATALTNTGRFAACSRANQLDVYDLSLGEPAGRLTDPHLAGLKQGETLLYPNGAADQDFVHSLAFDPSGTWLVSGGFRSVKLWHRPPQIQRRAVAVDPVPTAVAVSPNGQWIAVAAADNAIRLVQAADGQTAKSLAGHAASVTGLQFSADSTKLLSGSKDKTLRLWTVADGQPAGQLETPHEVLSVALNAEGNRAYSGQGDNHIRAWTVPFEAPKPAEGDKPAEPVKPVVQMSGNGGPVLSLAFVPGQPQIASGSQDGTFRVWDVNNGNQVRSMAHGAPVTSIAVKPDGQFFASAGGNVAKLWNVGGQQVVELKGDIATQRNVIQLTDDDAVAKSRVALADASFKAAEKNFQEREKQTKDAREAKDKTQKALEEAQGKEKTAQEAVAAAKKELEGKTDDEALKKKVADAEAAATKETDAVKKAVEANDAAMKAIAQSETGKTAADEQQKAAKQLHETEVAAQKQSEERLNVAKAAQPATEKPVRAVAFSLETAVLATAGDDGVVRTWDAKTGKPLDEFRAHTAPVTALAVGPDRTLVSLSEDKSVSVWDANPAWQYAGVLGPAADKPLDLTPSPFVDRVLALAFSPDGKRLATGGGDPSRSGELLLWNFATRTFLKAFPDAHSDTVFAVDFSRDGKWLASGAADKFVKVHDVESGKLVRSLEGHTHHVLGVTFKADGSRIASAGADNAIKIWNVETGEQHRTIQNYAKQVTAIRFIGTSDNAVSGSGDKSVKFHRANDGGNYRSFAGATDYVYSVAATRDEAIVIAGGEDGVLRVWNGTNGQSLFNFEPPKPPANQQANAK